MARWVVGIDLGTTNTVVAASKTDAPKIEVFPVEQRVAPGTDDARKLLPSALQHEDGSWIVGAYARARGAEVPNRNVASAKSWLAHPGVDRSAAILP
ncbi:MAG: Hsp70 family protein, partial [Polyangiales bacterium]